MEKFKGTSGPWFVSDNQSEINKKLSGKGYHFISTESGFYYDEHDSGFELSGCMSIHDANLIAAAPDLLEALQDAVSDLETTIRVGYDRIIELGGQCDSPEEMISSDSSIRKMKRAIARALGKNDGEE